MRRDRRRGRLLLALLLLAAGVLLAVDVRSAAASPFTGLRARTGDVLGPVQQAVAAVVRPVRDLAGHLGAGSAQDRVTELERANEQLRRDLQAAGLDRGRVAQLDGLLRLAGTGQYRIVPARVVAVGPAQGFAWTVTVDAGTRDGIAADMTVLNGEGLVGRVKLASESTSTVVLAADPSSAVGVRLENGQVGIAQGDGSGLLTVDLFNPTAEVAVGDRLVTFGSRNGTPYAWGVPVGEVVQVQGITGNLTKRATVRPFADPGAVDLVGVVVEQPRTDPRNAVLPPKPTPTPSATPTPEKTPTKSPEKSPEKSPKKSPKPSTSPSPRR